jgi:hypothetical protein
LWADLSVRTSITVTPRVQTACACETNIKAIEAAHQRFMEFLSRQRWSQHYMATRGPIRKPETVRRLDSLPSKQASLHLTFLEAIPRYEPQQGNANSKAPGTCLSFDPTSH